VGEAARLDDSRTPERKEKLGGRYLSFGRFGIPRGGSAAYVQVPTALKVARPGRCHKHGFRPQVHRQA